MVDFAGWQTAQLNFATQGINDSQYLFQAHGRLAGLKVDDEAHTHPRRQGQLGLRQPERLASGPQRIAKLLG